MRALSWVTVHNEANTSLANYTEEDLGRAALHFVARETLRESNNELAGLGNKQSDRTSGQETATIARSNRVMRSSSLSRQAASSSGWVLQYVFSSPG